VKLFDVLLGRSKPKQANLDALFAVTSAAITLEAAAGLRSSGQAAVCFKPASGQDFAATSKELTELLEMAVKEAGSKLDVTDDKYGYRWVVLADPDLEDLVTSVHLVNSTLQDHGFGSGPAAGHLVYLYKRGTFYPFAPRPGERRDNEVELNVRAVLGGELPIESDLTRWFALWGVPIS
jgi:hypothetical protein